MMSEHIDAYRSQIEQLNLPIMRTDEDDGWTTILFKHEFATIGLSSPSDTPQYCRLVVGYTLDPIADEDKPSLLARANANTDNVRIVKTVCKFNPDGAVLKYSCEFFSTEGFEIIPSLQRYLHLLVNASAEFDKSGQSTSDTSAHEEE
jgi:hypothetical protein